MDGTICLNPPGEVCTDLLQSQKSPEASKILSSCHGHSKRTEWGKIPPSHSLLFIPPYQCHLASQQKLCLTMQGFNIIHHLYNQAAVQTLWQQQTCVRARKLSSQMARGKGVSEKQTRTKQKTVTKLWQSLRNKLPSSTSVDLDLAYTLSIDLELALTAWASSCSMSW